MGSEWLKGAEGGWAIEPHALLHGAGLSPCVCRRHLPIGATSLMPLLHWQLLHVQLLSSILLGLVPTSPCVLSHRMPSQCHLPLHLRGCSCLIQVLLLPLVVGPRGMPHQPHLGASTAGGIWLLAGLLRQLGILSLVQGLAAANAAAPYIL
jgi:hypothetical protein